MFDIHVKLWQLYSISISLFSCWDIVDITLYIYVVITD
jgi:hypothetical protein